MGLEIMSTVPFRAYVSSVEDIAIAVLRDQKNAEAVSALPNLLDGQAGGRLRQTVPLRVRRELGAFFSSSDLRTAALDPCHFDAGVGEPILDPAMGAGDLLIEATRQLSADYDLSTTLKSWGQVLHGRDIQPDFVRLAKARLILTAVSRGAMPRGDQEVTLGNVFPGIRVGDGLGLLDAGNATGHIIMNPPFTHRDAPDSIRWSGGRTNSAAIFLAKAVEGAQPGTRITAILPDVIRTGSRYGRLRSLVANRLDVTAIQPYGQFDHWTDVDVFILKGVVVGQVGNESHLRWWHQTSGATVGDHFTVSVGTVVPHRDPESQPLRHYLHAKALPLGRDFQTADAEKRGFQKRTFSPPFVVVRRTSRPGDRSRGIGTLVCGTSDVLVENHLIVLKPKDGSTDTCRGVVDLLNLGSAKNWLDERIRCRHLTVGAMREMPWFES